MVYNLFYVQIIIQIIAVVYSCSFDDLVENSLNVPKFFVNYRSSRYKRDTSKYLPLRFSVYISKDETENAEKFKSILDEATTRVAELLHVIPVHGNLLLERTSCGSTWSSGPNKGRCSSIRAKHKEYCKNKIDYFRIPDEHLDKLDVYNFKDESPVYTIPAGKGDVMADYILYVRSKYTPWCQKQDIKAYASYCRLDQYGRPVAGYINFCPHSIDQEAFSRHDMIKVAIHEIFHAVGFSKDLFSEYRGCPFEETYCESPKHIIIEDSYNIPRLNLPSVKHEMKMHFDCQKSEFGAPLEVVNGSYTSHWNSLILYGSIMMPTIQSAGISLIDPITLSVFADTGWYYVDFSKANHYTWGKDEGCNFGLTDKCDSKEDLCAITDDEDDLLNGCDFLHNTQAKCQKLNPKHHCGVYMANSANDCRQQILTIGGKHLHNLKCFAKETEKEVQAMCTAYRCDSEKQISVLINHSWISCPFMSTVKVNDTILFCPKHDVFCNGEYEGSISHHELNSGHQFSMSVTMIIVLVTAATIWILIFGMVSGASIFRSFQKLTHESEQNPVDCMNSLISK